MNNITIELCAEDRARLDALIVLAARLTNSKEELPVVSPDKAQTGIELELEQLHPVAEDQAPWEAPAVFEPSTAKAEDEKPAEAPKTEKTEVPKVSRDDVRQKVVSLIAAGKKAEARAVVTAYAPGVPDIPEDKLAEVLEKLTAL